MKRTLFLITIAFSCAHAVAQTQVIAHRGFWKIVGSAQNSIAALNKADSIGCYGSEFDVWLTADNKLVVNHDSRFDGKNMEKSDAELITRSRLSNGKNLPTLEEYFDKARSLNTRLILELKSLNTVKRETVAVEKIIEMVKAYGLESRIEYIAFSFHAVKEFIRLAPAGTPVYYLNGDLSPEELSRAGCSGPDYNISVYRKHPEWIAESHRLGMKVNVWTVNKESDMQWCIDQGMDFITTDEPVKLQKLLVTSYQLQVMGYLVTG